MKNLRTVLLIALLGLLLFGAYMLYNELADKYEPEVPDVETENISTGEAEETLPSVEPAADFTVYDADGNAVKLSDFRGRPVVINFWATWCGYCVEEFPVFDRLSKRYGRDVEFMMVNLTDGRRDTVETATQFIADNGYDFPVYFDTENSAGISYDVSSIPVTVFVDADGTIIRTVTGMVSETLLTNTVIKMAGDD